MTKFKCELKNVNIVNVNEKRSKKDNKYFVLNCIYDGELINFYYPLYDSDLYVNDLLGVHDLVVEISISKYSSITVLEVK